MRRRSCFAAVLALCLLTSCQSAPDVHRGPPAAGPASVGGTAATRPAGGVIHMVVVWLKKPGDAADRTALIDASRALATIPGVADVRTGPVLPSTRPVVDSTYDVGLVVTFTDERALRNYLTHPTHLRLLNDVLKPLTDHYRVYDFRTDQ